MDLVEALNLSLDKDIGIKYCFDEPHHICLYTEKEDIFSGSIAEFLEELENIFKITADPL